MTVAERAKTGADCRYLHVICPTCGETWQVIDWGSVSHHSRCPRGWYTCADLTPTEDFEEVR